jgi:hypothetical protein
MKVNPWLTKQLVEIRVAELHRHADRERLAMAEPLLANDSQAGTGTWVLLRRCLGRALVRAGGRVGGFERPQAWTMGGPLNS